MNSATFRNLQNIQAKQNGICIDYLFSFNYKDIFYFN